MCFCIVFQYGKQGFRYSSPPIFVLNKQALDFTNPIRLFAEGNTADRQISIIYSSYIFYIFTIAISSIVYFIIAKKINHKVIMFSIKTVKLVSQKHSFVQYSFSGLLHQMQIHYPLCFMMNNLLSPF